MIRDEKSDKATVSQQQTNTSSGPAGFKRRKILGWMGVSIIGALAINALPFGLFRRRVFSGKSSQARQKSVAINDMAVKRNRKATRNV